MKVDHIALWTSDLEKMKEFYVRYFRAVPSEKYINPVKKFESYFLSFDAGSRVEIMRMPGIDERDTDTRKQFMGLTHLAISVGSKEDVDAITGQLRGDQYQVIGEPRTTGDGYYESVVLDPEGNRIEITV